MYHSTGIAQNMIANPFLKKGNGCSKCLKGGKPETPGIVLTVYSNIQGFIRISFDNKASSDTLLKIEGKLTYTSPNNIKGVTLYNESMCCYIDNKMVDKEFNKNKGYPLTKDTIVFNVHQQSLKDCEYDYKMLLLISSPDMYVHYPGATYMGHELPEYFLHKYEVTVGIYDYFVKTTNFKRNSTEYDQYSTHLNKHTGFESSDKKIYNYILSPNGEKYNLSRDHTDTAYPVVYVNQADINAFLDWLNNIDPEHIYSLPSKLEWEYAFQKGRSPGSEYNWSKDISRLERYANVGDLSLLDYPFSDRTRISENVLDSFPFLCKYDQKLEQNNGLYHMIGNVSEWTSDYKEVKIKDGKISRKYLYKGGSFYVNINQVDYKRDDYLDENSRHGRVGFRIGRKKKSTVKPNNIAE